MLFLIKSLQKSAARQKISVRRIIDLFSDFVVIISEWWVLESSATE